MDPLGFSHEETEKPLKLLEVPLNNIPQTPALASKALNTPHNAMLLVQTPTLNSQIFKASGLNYNP